MFGLVLEVEAQKLNESLGPSILPGGEQVYSLFEVL